MLFAFDSPGPVRWENSGKVSRIAGRRLALWMKEKWDEFKKWVNHPS